MSDITFSCPHCQNPLVVEEDGAGLEIPCPVCAHEITIPESSENRTDETDESGLEVGGVPLTESDLDRLAQEILRRTKGGGDDAARVLKRDDGGRDIAFNCPACATHLVVDIAGAGVEIPCPNCEKPLTIPDPVQDVESFLASALASRLGTLADGRKLGKSASEQADGGIGASTTESGRTRIPLKPKFRARKTQESTTASPFPFLVPHSSLGEGGTLPEELAKAAAEAHGSGGYVIVPIQTPDGPAAMITQAPKTADEGANRKRPRYPRKYSDLAAKLRSAEPADAGRTGEALEELQKRGPLVSRVLAQHFIEKALEEPEEGDDAQDPRKSTGPLGHRGALKSPRRLDLQGEVLEKESAPPAEKAVPTVEPTGTLPASHRKPPKHRPHGRPGRKSGNAPGKKTLLMAMALVAGVITLAALSYNYLVDSHMDKVVAALPAPSIPPPTEKSNSGDEPVILPPLEQNTARAVITGFCQAPQWEDLLKYVRNPERVEPLMRKYYQDRPYQPQPIQEVRNLQSVYSKGKLMVSAQAITADSYQEIPFLLIRTPGGAYQVDWEFVVEYNPYTWTEYRQLRPTEPVTFRVLLTPAEYYNFEFADSKVYQCFKVDDRQLGFSGVYAYVRRDTAVSERLETEMRQSLPLPCMVKLSFPPESTADNLVEITEFVSRGWLVDVE